VTFGQLLFIATMYGVGLFVSIVVLLLDDIAFGMLTDVRTRFRMVAIAIVEHLIFRPMTIWWRLGGLVFFLRGRSDWGVQVRRGFGPNSTPGSPLPRV
jgi:hypothetical protein